MGNHVAIICKSEHLITSYGTKNIESKYKFCNACGDATISCCTSCGEPIIGSSDSEYSDFSEYVIPAYCGHCGTPYPWTADKINSMREFLVLDSKLSKDELEYLSSNLNSLLIDTPRTKLVATKFKLGLSKLGRESAAVLRDTIIDIASETAKKIIIGQ